MANAPRLAADTLTRAVAVYPLVPTRSFDDPLTYAVAPGVDLRIGMLVEVPVGNAQRVGVVADIDVVAPEGVDLKHVGRLIDTPAIPENLLRLAEWTADTYGCARTRALAMVVPPRFATHARASTVPTRRRVAAVRRAPAAGDPADSGLSSRLAAVAARLPTEWTALTDVLAQLGTTRPSVVRLVDANLAELEQREVAELEQAHDAAADEPADGGTDAPRIDGSAAAAGIQLTDEQVAAVDLIEATTGDSDPATLLVGITGSGKTEVYLELIDRALAVGRAAIVLVPEIALTPQTSRRFRKRFGDSIEVLHSNLTKAQRVAAYDRIRAGQRRVVVGARSAIFAPLDDVGVVIVDEEHDPSYKQDSEPRYDARRVAWRRARDEGASLVLGSATPRPESWHGVKRRVYMRTRPGGGQLPPIEVVDLRDNSDRFPLTDQVRAAIDATMRRDRKAIVLHNRRGYSTALHCRSCGHTFRCDACDVTLVVHGHRAPRQSLACHHCGFTTPVPEQCPECRSADVARMGAGTERLERDLNAAFDVPVLRLDTDTSKRAGALDEILTAFAQPGPAILTGTQMVAKGHDFPDVELAVVIDADTALAIPDFRAEERAFSMVAQLAGRAGRSASTAEHARVLVQTWDPDGHFLKYARTHDVPGFLDTEVERRLAHDYPPATRLVRVLISAPRPDDATTWANAVAAGLRTTGIGDVLGPAPCMRIADRHRAQVLLKTHKATVAASTMQRFLRTTAGKRRRPDVRIVLDVDPQSLG